MGISYQWVKNHGYFYHGSQLGCAQLLLPKSIKIRSCKWWYELFEMGKSNNKHWFINMCPITTKMIAGNLLLNHGIGIYGMDSYSKFSDTSGCFWPAKRCGAITSTNCWNWAWLEFQARFPQTDWGFNPGLENTDLLHPRNDCGSPILNG